MIINYSEFKTKDIKFREPMQLHKNFTKININVGNQKNSTKKIVIQTPKLYIPFGLSTFENSYYLNGSLASYKFEQNTKDFYKLLRNIVKEAKTHVKTKRFIKKQQFYNFIKIKDDYPPSIRLKINPNELRIYNSRKQPLTINDICSRVYCKCIISISDIWISNKQYGINLELKQILLYNSNVLQEYSFIPDKPIEPVKQLHNTHSMTMDGIKEKNTHVMSKKHVLVLEGHVSETGQGNGGEGEEVVKTLGDTSVLKKYFKMKKMGIPPMALVNKMMMDTLDKEFHEYIHLNASDPIPTKLQELLDKKDNENNYDSNDINGGLNSIVNGVSLAKVKPLDRIKKNQSNKNVPTLEDILSAKDKLRSNNNTNKIYDDNRVSLLQKSKNILNNFLKSRKNFLQEINS
jgi:hypothetical protein